MNTSRRTLSPPKPGGNSGIVFGGEHQLCNYDTLRDKSTLIPLYDVLQGRCAVRHKAELHRGFNAAFHSPKESDNTVVEHQ